MYYNTKPNQNGDPFNEIIEKLRPPQGGTHLYPDAKGQYWAPCPFHNDQQKRSFSFNANTFHCITCNTRGSLIDLGEKLGIDGYSKEIKKPYSGITLQEYSDCTKLPQEFLQFLRVFERKQNGIPRVYMPYFDLNEQKVGNHIRTTLNGTGDFYWSNGSRPTLYGLWMLEKPLQCCIETQEHSNYIILVEEESDAQTLWFYGFPALGVPSVNMWQSEWKKYLEGKEVYIWQSSDERGSYFSQKIGKDITDIKIIASPENRKKINECHVAGDNIPKLIPHLMEEAFPFSKILDDETNKELERLSKAASIWKNRDILEEVVEFCERSGVVGEKENILLLYIAITSRILDKPLSVAIKGTSSVGKSYVLKKVLTLFPENAYFDISSMSDKALLYTDEPFEHRFLIVSEASGLDSAFATYLIRTLLSEGQIKHITVDSTEHGNEGRTLEKNGPTGLITTTTKINLHPENETRLISIEISDSPVQTRKIFCKLADDYMGNVTCSPSAENFVNFQLWLEKFGNKKVTIPYAKIVAELTDPSAVRLRRDFDKFFRTIMTIAIINQQQRQFDQNGYIVSTIEDYDIAYDLLSKKMNEDVGRLISSVIRETVTAVEQLIGSQDSNLVDSMKDENGEERFYVDNKTLANELRLDESATSRRVAKAIKGGFLENLETRKGKRAKIAIGKRIVDDDLIFPAPEKVKLMFETQLESHAIVQHSIVNSEETNE